MSVEVAVLRMEDANAKAKVYDGFSVIEIRWDDVTVPTTLFFQSANQGENIRKANMIADIINGDA